MMPIEFQDAEKQKPKVLLRNEHAKTKKIGFMCLQVHMHAKLKSEPNRPSNRFWKIKQPIMHHTRTALVKVNYHVFLPKTHNRA